MHTYSMHFVVVYFFIPWIVLVGFASNSVLSIQSDMKRTAAAFFMLVASFLIIVPFLITVLASEPLWK
jgi:hypothetical protein